MVRFALMLVALVSSTVVFAAESATSPKMVICTDGTKSEAGQGACSHHGGVQPATSQKPQTTGKPATPGSHEEENDAEED